jgi:hypothetical protein
MIAEQTMTRYALRRLYGALRVEAKLDQHHNSKLFETVKSEARVQDTVVGFL